MNGIDKRKVERFPLELPAFLKVGDESEGETVEFVTSDVCSGGAFFPTDKPIPVGTEVKVDLVIPIDQLKKIEADKVLITVAGSVIRTEKRGMAVCFDNKYKIMPIRD